MSSAYGRTSTRETERQSARASHSAESLAASLGSLPFIAVLALSLRILLQFQLELGSSLGFPHPSVLWSCTLLAITAPLGIVIHEFGHYAAGVATGQCCRSIVVGPLEMTRSGRGWRVRWIRPRRAGLVDFVPSTFAQFRLKRAICVAAGPVASLLSGLLFTALSFHVHQSFLFWILSFSVQWALIGFLGLLPMRREETRSDGYLLWELARGGAAVDDLQRNLLVASSHATSLRLRDWPHDLLLRLAKLPAEGQAGRYSAYLAFVHLLDRGEIHSAAACLDGLMAQWDPADPPEYALEAACFLAQHRNQLEFARRWLRLEPRDAEPWVRLRARAAIEQASGNAAPSRELVEQALAALESAPPCGAHQYEIDRLREIRPAI